MSTLKKNLLLLITTTTSGVLSQDLCAKAYPDGTCQTCTVQNDMPQCDVTVYGFTQPVTFNSNGPVVDYNAPPVSCASVYGIGCGDCNRQNCVLKCCNTVDNTAFIDPVSGFSVPCSTPTLPSVPNGFNSGCLSCNSNTCLECAMGWLLKGNVCERCSSHFGSGCSQCTQDMCTVTDTGNYIKNGTSYSCKSDFGTECATCDSVRGCTSLSVNDGTVFLKKNVNTTLLVASPCNPDMGQNCQTCNSTACTSLRSPVGTICNFAGKNNQGIYCMQLGSTCQQCSCSTTNSPVCTLKSTTSTYFVNKDGFVEKCQDQVLFGGQYCLTCNRTGCTQAMSNSALNLTNPFQAIPCSSSFYGTGCATCNSTSCKTALTGFSIDPINSTRSASCATMWGEGCTTCGLTGCTASVSGYALVDGVNRRDFSRKGTRCSKCTDTRLGSGTLNCRSFKQTSSGTRVVYNHETTSVTSGYCMPIDSQTGLRVTRKCSEDNTVLTCRSNDCFPIKVVDGKCVNSKGKVINKNFVFNANTVPPELVNSLTLCRVRSEVGCVFRITNNPGFSIDVIDRLQFTFNWNSNANLYAGVSVLDIDPMTAMEKVVAPGRPQMFTVAKKVNNNNPQCLILPLQMEIRVMSSNTLVYPAEELCPVYNDCETIVNNDRRRNVDVVPFITKNRRGGDKSLDIKECIYGRKVYDPTRTVTYSDGTKGPYITGCDCSANPTFELKNKECVCKDKKLEIRFVRNTNSYQCMDPDVYTKDEICDPIAIWNPSTEECECPVGFEGSGRIDDKKSPGCVKIEDLVGGCVKHGVTNTDDAVCKESNWIVTKSYSTNGKPPVSFAFSWNGGVNQPSDTPTPRCYTRQEDLKTGNNKVDWKKPQACFCHRTCSESKPYVRVEADIWSAHCEAVGRGGDFCCGAPGEFYTDMTDGKIYDRSTCRQTGSTGGWSECTENDWVYTGTCGTVTRTCVRTCTNPIPTGGGQCEGSSTIVETVVLQNCPEIVTPITVVVQPLGQCCGSDSGCHKGPCGDPHICTPNPNSGSTTCFDTYARGGTFRIMDLVVYDRFQQLHERLIIDSVFTTSGQTMMRDVTINVNGKTATYVFGESGIVVEGKNISTIDGFVAVSDHVDNTELFHVWFNNATQTFKISPCRYPFLSLFYTIPNREMHMNMYVPGDGNQFTWVASGGLLGLNLPTKKNTVLSVTEKTAMRLDDLISRTFWDNWVTECQGTVGQMCNTYNLTKITNPLVFLSGSPVGPPDSSFMGWVDVSNYGIETIFPAVPSKSLKDMGAQRCFINQWVHEWAIAPPVNDSSSIFATEHFTQCALMKNSAIDNYYQNRWPVAYNNVKKTLGLVSRRRRDTSNPTEVMVQIAVNKLSEHCKFDTNMQGVCGAALLPNGVTIGQAETVRAEFDVETGQVVGSSMNVYYSTIGETDLFLLEADTLNVLQQGTCREGEVPSMTKKNTYLSVTAGFEVVEVGKLEMDILNTFFGERIKNINTDFNNRRRNARNTEQQSEIDHAHFLALEYTKNSWDDIMVDSTSVNHCVSEPESCFPSI